MPFDVVSHISEPQLVTVSAVSILFPGIGEIIPVGAWNRVSYQGRQTEVVASTWVLAIEKSNDMVKWVPTGKSFSLSDNSAMTSSFAIDAMFHRVTPSTAADARVVVSVRLIAEPGA